jgi:hypothetical protein
MTPFPDDRVAHVKWCKARALQYLDAGDLINALASMGSDMAKRDDCRINQYLYLVGMDRAAAGDSEGLRRWIRGFQ